MRLGFARSFLFLAATVVLAANLGDCESACDVPCLVDVVDIACATALCGENSNSPDRVNLLCRPACKDAINGNDLKKCLGDETIPRPRKGLISSALKALVLRTCRATGGPGEREIPEAVMRLIKRLGFFPENFEGQLEEFDEPEDFDGDDDATDDWEGESDPVPDAPYDPANWTDKNTTTWEPAANSTWNTTESPAAGNATWDPYMPYGNTSWVNGTTWDPYVPYGNTSTWGNSTTWAPVSPYMPYGNTSTWGNGTTWDPYMPYGNTSTWGNNTAYVPISPGMPYAPVSPSMPYGNTSTWGNGTTWEAFNGTSASPEAYLNGTNYSPVNGTEGSHTGGSEYGEAMEFSPVVLPVPETEDGMPTLETVDETAEEPLVEEGVVEGPTSEDEEIIEVLLEGGL